MKYDLIYSCTAHEKHEVVYNLYENIMKFHKGLNVLVLFHCNPPLYKDCVDLLPQHDNLVFHPTPTFKERFTSSLFLAHLANFKYMQDIDFEFFCTLASNCMFVHPPLIDIIRNETPHLKVTQTGYKMPDPDRWSHTEFVKNAGLVEIFKQLDAEVCLMTHEGAYFRKQTMGAMVALCDNWGINKELFVNEIAAEEIVLPSLEKYLTGAIGKRYCAWIPGITMENVADVIATGTCKSLAGTFNNILKIPRDMNNPMRKLLTERTPQFV